MRWRTARYSRERQSTFGAQIITHDQLDKLYNASHYGCVVLSLVASADGGQKEGAGQKKNGAHCTATGVTTSATAGSGGGLHWRLEWANGAGRAALALNNQGDADDSTLASFLAAAPQLSARLVRQALAAASGVEAVEDISLDGINSRVIRFAGPAKGFGRASSAWSCCFGNSLNQLEPEEEGKSADVGLNLGTLLLLLTLPASSPGPPAWLLKQQPKDPSLSNGFSSAERRSASGAGGLSCLAYDAMPLAVTTFAVDGGIRHQNAASCSYYGRRTGSNGKLASATAAAWPLRGEGEGDGGGEPSLLRQLFAVDPCKLEDMLGRTLGAAAAQGGVWEGIVRVPASLNPGGPAPASSYAVSTRLPELGAMRTSAQACRGAQRMNLEQILNGDQDHAKPAHSQSRSAAAAAAAADGMDMATAEAGTDPVNIFSTSPMAAATGPSAAAASPPPGPLTPTSTQRGAGLTDTASGCVTVPEGPSVAVVTLPAAAIASGATSTMSSGGNGLAAHPHGPPHTRAHVAMARIGLGASRPSMDSVRMGLAGLWARHGGGGQAGGPAPAQPRKATGRLSLQLAPTWSSMRAFGFGSKRRMSGSKRQSDAAAPASPAGAPAGYSSAASGAASPMASPLPDRSMQVVAAAAVNAEAVATAAEITASGSTRSLASPGPRGRRNSAVSPLQPSLLPAETGGQPTMPGRGRLSLNLFHSFTAASSAARPKTTHERDRASLTEGFASAGGASSAVAGGSLYGSATCAVSGMCTVSTVGDNATEQYTLSLAQLREHTAPAVQGQAADASAPMSAGSWSKASAQQHAQASPGSRVTTASGYNSAARPGSSRKAFTSMNPWATSTWVLFAAEDHPDSGVAAIQGSSGFASGLNRNHRAPSQNSLRDIGPLSPMHPTSSQASDLALGASAGTHGASGGGTSGGCGGDGVRQISGSWGRGAAGARHILHQSSLPPLPDLPSSLTPSGAVETVRAYGQTAGGEADGGAGDPAAVAAAAAASDTAAASPGWRGATPERLAAALTSTAGVSGADDAVHTDQLKPLPSDVAAASFTGGLLVTAPMPIAAAAAGGAAVPAPSLAPSLPYSTAPNSATGMRPATATGTGMQLPSGGSVSSGPRVMTFATSLRTAPRGPRGSAAAGTSATSYGRAPSGLRSRASVDVASVVSVGPCSSRNTQESMIRSAFADGLRPGSEGGRSISANCSGIGPGAGLLAAYIQGTCTPALAHASTASNLTAPDGPTSANARALLASSAPSQAPTPFMRKSRSCVDAKAFLTAGQAGGDSITGMSQVGNAAIRAVWPMAAGSVGKSSNRTGAASDSDSDADLGVMRRKDFVTANRPPTRRQNSITWADEASTANGQQPSSTAHMNTTATAAAASVADAGVATAAGAGAGLRRPPTFLRLASQREELGEGFDEDSSGGPLRASMPPPQSKAAERGAAEGVAPEVAADVDQAEDEERSSAGAGTASGLAWHEVCASAVEDPGSGARYLVVVQKDVTAKVEAERHIAQVSEAEHRLLEQIFPRHVLAYMTEEAFSPAQPEPPAPQPTSAELGPIAAAASPGASATAPCAAYHHLCPATAHLTWRPHVRDCTELATWHPEVTVLFADIQGFTPMCKQLPPTVVMQFLNDLFVRFDAMLDAYGVYKVETIGDCYVVAGGLITEDADGMAAVQEAGADPQQADRVFAFARAMLRSASSVRMPTTGEAVKIRVGIHSGPVVSGVVGTRMPRFCLFGDTINTASRMESTSKPGCVHVSSDTYALLSVRDAGWAPTGGLEVKGKGHMETYLWALPDATAPTAPAALASPRVLTPALAGAMGANKLP